MTWIHGVERLRGASMSKWVASLGRELEGGAESAGLDITVDQIGGLPLPFLKGTVNRYLLYSLHARGLGADLFHVHDHANAHLVPLLPAGTPKVLTVHDLYMLDQPAWRVKSYPFKVLNVPGIRRADHIIAVSGYMRDEIARRLDYPAERISVAYCGIDHSLYGPGDGGRRVPPAYGLGEDEDYVLFVGSEIPRKNFSAVLRVFKALCAERAFRDLRLVKVGNPGSRRDREVSLRNIAELGLEGKVLFCGFVPEEDLPLFYTNASLLLAPSFYEGGSGMHVIEAMACGCPVVASDIPQSRELAGGGALHCDPRDDGEIRDAARSLLTDDALRREMVARGLARAREFSWSKSAREHLRVYRLLS